MTHRYQISVCAILKNEMPYLLEWIAFHRCLGVEHFFLFDNGSSDGSFEFLRSLESIGLVTVIRWPNLTKYPDFEGNAVGPQVPAYNFALKLLRSENLAKWVAFIDLDEFIVPTNGNFADVLAKYRNHAGLAMNWRVFGSSGLKTKTKELVIEKFKTCSTREFVANKHVKCCVQVDKITKANTHICYPREGDIVRTNSQKVNYNKDGVEDIFCDDEVVINHYFVKSYEEWTVKRMKGRPSRPIGDRQRYRNDRMFSDFDRNEMVDDRILRFLGPTMLEMDRIKQHLTNA